MELLDAHEILGNMTTAHREDLLNMSCTLEPADDGEPADVWPAVVCGGLVVLNLLSGIDDEADLCDAVRHLSYYASDHLIDQAEWEAETLRVIEQLCRWGDAQPDYHTANASRN